jgi:uncharacterized membrane protein YfhO
MAPAEIQKNGLQPLLKTNEPLISAATNYQLLPNATAFDIHAPSAGIVCLTEEQAKDFRAIANGESKEIFTVNRAFKGIYLDKPGDYHVEFIYRPRFWRLSCALFWTTAVFVIVLAGADFFRFKNSRKIEKIRAQENSTT